MAVVHTFPAVAPQDAPSIPEFDPQRYDGRLVDGLIRSVESAEGQPRILEADSVEPPTGLAGQFITVKFLSQYEPCSRCGTPTKLGVRYSDHELLPMCSGHVWVKFAEFMEKA